MSNSATISTCTTGPIMAFKRSITCSDFVQICTDIETAFSHRFVVTADLSSEGGLELLDRSDTNITKCIRFRPESAIFRSTKYSSYRPIPRSDSADPLDAFKADPNRILIDATLSTPDLYKGALNTFIKSFGQNSNWTMEELKSIATIFEEYGCKFAQLPDESNLLTQVGRFDHCFNEWDFVLRDASFGKVSELSSYTSQTVLLDFFNKLCNGSIHIPFSEFSNIYVLMARASSERFLRDEETSFKSILNVDQYQYLQEHGSFILGYMLTSKSKNLDNTHFIEMVDTTVRGYNLTEFMIKKYESYLDWEISLLPREFIEESVAYWVNRYPFDSVVCPDGIWEFTTDNKEEQKHIMNEMLLEDFNEDFNIDSLGTEIEWALLYSAFRKYISDRIDSGIKIEIE